MVIHKRRKISRQRGSWSHGWGAKKKHRGSGNRGGCGMAGTGKRADSKKPSIWGDPHYFGRFGFTPKGVKEKIKAVNLSYFEEHFEKLVEEKKIEHKEGIYVIDLSMLGFNKLLGTGNVSKKCRFIAKYASSGAVDKVKENGGEVVTLEENKETQ